MGLDICKQHPGQRAIGHCETCHVPVCEQCVVRSSDPKLAKKCFCSEEHRVKFEQYKDAMGDKKIKPMRPPSIITSVIKLAVLVAIAYLIVRFVKPDLIPAQFRYF